MASAQVIPYTGERAACQEGAPGTSPYRTLSLRRSNAPRSRALNPCPLPALQYAGTPSSLSRAPCVSRDFFEHRYKGSDPLSVGVEDVELRLPEHSAHRDVPRPIRDLRLHRGGDEDGVLACPDLLVHGSDGALADAGPRHHDDAPSPRSAAMTLAALSRQISMVMVAPVGEAYHLMAGKRRHDELNPAFLDGERVIDPLRHQGHRLDGLLHRD